jgi:hypothetical protein
MTETNALSAEVTQTTETPAAADTEPTKVTPQGTDPAGQSEAQPAADEQQDAQDGEKELTDAEKRRKERNRERWRNMRREMEDSRKRAYAAEAEVRRLRGLAPPDYSQITDPDEVIAEKTAAKLRESSAAEIERQGQAAREQAQAAMQEAWSAHAEEMRAKYADFDQVFGSTTPIHQVAAPFIAESENGGEIAYYLAKNPAEARALYDKFQVNPAQGLVELGRIEARVNVPPAKKTSAAPRPAAVLNGGRNPPAFDPASASVSDVAAQLRKAGVI